MPQNLQHVPFDNVALPYKTYNSATSTDPAFVSGSTNIRTVSIGTAQLRPGFATPLEPKSFVFTNLQRLYPWKTWADGTRQSQYIWMASDLDSGVAKVYKFIAGVDNSFSLIWTSTSAEPFDFVDSNNCVFFSNGTDAKLWEPVNGITNWGIAAPNVAPGITLVPDPLGISAYSGYYYGYTFYDSLRGHESDMSPLSACTALFTLQHVYVTPSVTPVRSADRFDTINWYRTTDGGSTDPSEMAFVGSTSIGTPQLTDSTLDASLSATQFAPPLLRNEPPVPMKGLCTYAGRIWGYFGNKVYFSGQEEIANGVPQECFPSGSDGNFYQFESEVNGIAPLPDGVAPYLAIRIWKIEGDSLDTFRRYKLLDKRGTVQRAALKAVGSSVVWFDTASQVWGSDMGEIGRDIRPDLSTVTDTSACLEVHISNQFHWILVSDPATSRLLAFDLDTKQWMPPWNVKVTAMASGETSTGVVNLCAAINGTKVMMLTDGVYADNGATYASTANLNLIQLCPKTDIDHLGVLGRLTVEGNQYPPNQVGVVIDDDPAQAGFTALTSTGLTPVLSNQGTYLKQTEFSALTDTPNRAGRRVGIQIQWNAPSSPSQGWIWNTLDLGVQAGPTR